MREGRSTRSTTVLAAAILRMVANFTYVYPRIFATSC
jgi:hypothetical protein